MSLRSRQTREKQRGNNQRLKPVAEDMGSTENRVLCEKSVASMAADYDVVVRHSASWIVTSSTVYMTFNRGVQSQLRYDAFRYRSNEEDI